MSNGTRALRPRVGALRLLPFAECGVSSGPGPRRWRGRGRNAEPLRARLDEVTEVGGADSRGRAVPDGMATVTEQGVPGQVEGPLHWLAVDRRQTAAVVRDRPYQAGAGHRPPVVAVRVPPGGRPQLIALRAVGEQAVLHPAAGDQGVRGAMNVRIWCSSASCAAARSRRARSRRSWRCCVQRDSLFCAVRGFSSSVGRRSGRHGPDYPRAPPPGIRPRRVGFARPLPSR